MIKKKCVKERKARETEREKTEVDACVAIRIQSVNDLKKYNLLSLHAR